MFTEALLDIRGLCTGYSDAEVLHDVDLTVGAGEIVAVLGANGVGKSTLNRTISGVVRAWSGTIRFGGVAIEREKPAAIVARGLIHVPEGRRIFPNLSVQENLDLGSYRRAAARRAANRARVFEIFPRLHQRRSQRAGTLSGGEQQMLAIGRGLMAEPTLLILDEPSLGLSPLMVEELFALVARIHDDGVASCWSSRTSCRASKSPAAPMFSPTGNALCRARPQSLLPIRNLNALTWDYENLGL